MKYQTRTRAELYLLSLLEFELGGQAVRLTGGLRVSPGELLFVLGDDMPVDPRLLPEGGPPAQIDEPLGMHGVRLDELGASARLYRDAAEGSTVFDLTVHGRASLSTTPALTLEAALVFEHAEPRLAVVTLSAAPRLTLADFARSVTGGAWDWRDGVADDFAFESGSLYALKAPKGAAAEYRYRYSVAGNELDLAPGYGAEAIVDLFGKPFAVSLVVHTPLAEQGGRKKKPWIVLETSAVTPIHFDFVELRSPRLEICTGPTASDRYLRLATEVSILETPVDFTVSASYRNRRFEGSLEVPFGGLDLPVVGGSHSADVTLEIDFEWAQGHFHITRLGGLPSLPHDFADRFASVLNDVQGAFKGGCESMVGDWLKGAASTSISLGLTKGQAPSKSGGQMMVPITVTWTLSVAGEHFDAPIELRPAFDVPKKLADLPGALCHAVVDNAGTIAENMLSDKDFYVALSAEVARRVGAKAAARMLCRALERFGKELAKKLAELVKDAVAETLAEAAALAAALTAVALAGIHEIVDKFVEFFEDLWDLITGNDDDKEEAEAQLRAQIAQVQAAMQVVRDKVEDARRRLTVQTLDVEVDRAGELVATWSTKPLRTKDLGEGLSLGFTLEMLTGEAGDEGGSSWPGSEPVTRDRLETSYSVPLRSIPDSADYRFNAKIVATLRGVRFLPPPTKKPLPEILTGLLAPGEMGDLKPGQALQSAIDKLADADSSVAHAAAKELQKTLEWLRHVDAVGIESEPRWAHLAMPAYTTVGASLVGVNTRVRGS